MWVNKDDNSSFNFKAPRGYSGKQEILFPVTDKQDVAYAATRNLAVKAQKTIVKVGILTGALALTVTTDAQVEIGAELYVVVTSDANVAGRVVTPGAGFSQKAVTVLQNKTDLLYFIYDGASFLCPSVNQIN